MKPKNEKYRHIIFLILIISGTIITYTSWFYGDKKNDVKENNLTDGSRNPILLRNEKDAEKLFGIFIKNPNSEEGINSLFDAIVCWELHGKKESVKNAMKKFEALIKDNSLKDRFYNRLGQYYISAFNKLSAEPDVKFIDAYFILLNPKAISSFLNI
ncbi:MAG: hypothetical protein FIA82_01900 [Melioribacter sp.]|nr:hypothetical protein [Melioribacter sp.]